MKDAAAVARAISTPIFINGERVRADRAAGELWLLYIYTYIKALFTYIHIHILRLFFRIVCSIGP